MEIVRLRDGVRIVLQVQRSSTGIARAGDFRNKIKTVGFSRVVENDALHAFGIVGRLSHLCELNTSRDLVDEGRSVVTRSRSFGLVKIAETRVDGEGAT